MTDPYKNALDGAAFRNWEHKSISLLGMSGVGKTTLCSKLPKCRWFHYSGDYRLGTRYMDEHILDNIKREAMKVPFLAELLRSDSMYICHNITISNLSPLSTYLGKVGNPGLGGITVEEFLRRQSFHMEAEIRAMYDVEQFMKKAWNVYGYSHFVNDAGGSLCELGDKPLFEMLAARTLIVYLKASGDMLEELIRRAQDCPKPMYYTPEFFQDNLAIYMTESGLDDPDQIVPDDFVRWIFPRLVAYRLPLYEQIADRYGVTIDARCIQDLENEQQVIDMIADALDARK